MDENFLIDKKWFFDVTSSLNIPYFIFARGEDLCDETMLNQLATSGCKVISVGFESGSQQIHKNARTGKDVERMVLGIHKAAKVGINIRLNLIIGLPGETWDTIKETVEKVNQLDFASYSLNHFVAYPGTYWYKDYEGSLSNLYCACGHNSGFCSSSLVGEWREYMLQNIRNDKKLLFRGASQRRQQGG